MSDKKLIVTRRKLIKSAVAGGAAAVALPRMHFIRDAHAEEYCNMPKGKEVVLGFNVPQTGRRPARTPTRAPTSCAPSSWQ